MDEPLNCREVAERLDRYLDGGLDERERERLECHLEGCDDCGELHAARAIRRGEGREPPADLIDTVLARTSGSACRSAHERLPDWVDGILAPADGTLVSGHIDRCAECRTLSGVLERMGQELPLLADLDPGPGFTGRVLERTSRVRVLPAAAGWSERWKEYWNGLTRRPRFALEASYIGAILLFLIFGTSASPLAGVPRLVIELATVNPVAELREPGSRLQTRVSNQVEEAWQSTRAQLASVSREAAGEVAAFSDQALDRLERDLGTLWQRIASEQENETTEGQTAEPETTDESQQGDRP